MAQIVQSKLKSRVAACLLMQLPDVDHVSGLASSGGETPLIAYPAAQHSQSILGERQGSTSCTRFPFRHECISLRQMYILGPEAEHLGGPHAGTEDQYADIMQSSRGSLKICTLFIMREDMHAILRLGQHFYPGHRIVFDVSEPYC